VTSGLARFLDRNGRVRTWPSRDADRELVAVYLSSRFERDARYDEAEVNQVLQRWHVFDDWALLRRELCDRGLLVRDDAGRSYQRAERRAR
jgi:hypothetical protein